MISNNLTIVIPCKNEEKYIASTLYALNNQVGIRGVDVIIADGGSTDSTRNIIEQVKSKLNYNLYLIEGGSVSVGRNRGASFIEKEFILFIDADVTFIENDTIVKSYYALKKGYNILTCKTVSRSPSLISKFSFFVFRLVQKYMKECFVTGVYFMTRRDKFIEFGGFDETTKHTEDYLLSRKYRKSRMFILNRRVTQDDRRFKKMGYFNFLRIMIKNYKNRDNIQHFRNDINYWS